MIKDDGLDAMEFSDRSYIMNSTSPANSSSPDVDSDAQVVRPETAKKQTEKAHSRQAVQRGISKNAHRPQQTQGGPNGPTPPSQTQPGPPPPSAPSPPRSGGGLKILGGGLVVTAGALGGSYAYAKANPEFRQQVESNWPFLVPLTSAIFQDDAQPEDSPVLGGLSAPLGTKGELPIVPGTKPPKPAIQEEGSKTSQTLDRTPAEAASSPPSAEQKAEQEALAKAQEEAKAKELEQKLIEQEISEAAEIAAIQAILDETLNSAVNTAAAAVDSQTATLALIKDHTGKLKVALDTAEDTPTVIKDQQWNDVIEAAQAKVDSQKMTDAQMLAAREEMEKLRSVIAEGEKMQKMKKYGADRNLIGARRTLLQVQGELDAAEKKKSKAERESRMLKDCHDLLEKSREQFKKELASIMPEVKLGRRGTKLSEEELNAIIAYSHRRVEQLHRQLAEQQAMEEKRLALALERQQEEDEGVNREEISREVERKRAEWVILQEQKIADLRREYEDEMRVQLRRQTAAHSDHMAEVLRVQAKQLEAKMAEREADVRQEEQSTYQRMLNGAMARLRGVEDAIEGRADLEKQNKKSQELWLACEALKQTIATGKLGGRDWEDKLKPLANEVVAIREIAGSDNQFVNSVVDKIPETALRRGVFSRDSLQERWGNIQRTCKRVAMIDEDGGSVFRYFISYFQSLLVFTDSIPPLEDEEIDPDSLDVFKLVAYTTFHVERGELEQALRYANLLEGMPRKVAGDWVKEVRLLLETSQVADVLTSHATATGLGGLKVQ